MAYVAVISLKQTINGLLNSSRISLVSSSREILEVAYNQTTSLQQLLERFNDSSSSKRLDDLDVQIRDCAHGLEDVLEFYELRQHEDDPISISPDHFEEVRQEITSFAERVNKIETEYIQELSKPAADENYEASVSSNIDLDVEMVGRSVEFDQTREYLLRRTRPDDLSVFAMVGEAGTGRSMAVKTIFEDLCTGRKQPASFDCSAWVTLGKKYQFKEVLICIAAQVSNSDDESSLDSRGEEEIGDYLYQKLENKRYMIVLDDICDMQALDCLRKSLPDESNGSIVMATTSIKELAQSVSLKMFETPAYYFEEISWFILRDAMFGSVESIPRELEKAGMKIAENCRGRAISLAKTLLFLSVNEKTPEQWSKIAADKENPIFMIGDEIAEIHEIHAEMQLVLEVDALKTQWVTKLIDFSDYVRDVKRVMYPKFLFSRMETIPFIGMAGIGKTTFVKKVFQDKSLCCHFDCRAWVHLGPNYQAGEILIDILAQIYSSFDRLHMKGDGKLVNDLCAQLSNKRCLIVLDDLWSNEPLHHLKKLFPNIRGKALVTTRLSLSAFGEDDSIRKMPLLNKEQSWCLLRQKVFVEGLCPPKLEKAGQIIAKNCEGLPLLILKVADQLLKVEKTLEYWNNVASGKENLVFKNAHDEISRALLPSYNLLPQHLKACFLYTGVFHKSYEIPISRLTNMLVSEGFLDPSPQIVVEDFAANCLIELVCSSFVMVHHMDSTLQIKRYRLHSVFWHLANSEDVNHYFQIVNSYADCSIDMKSHRRLSIRNSSLLGIEDVHNLMASMTTTHSLLCVSPLHKYPVPICFDMRLLRVMDALTIRLYEFPVEVVKLVHLRYLSLTCNGELSPSISKLQKLQHLIVGRYMNTNSSENSLPLPVEIWDMMELKHLQIMGGCLPNPKCGVGLPKLSTLLDVSAQSCTEKVLEMIPNLKRLGIRIELPPDGEDNPFHYLDHISRLSRLESLKCVVLNPKIGSEVVPPPLPLLMFPSSLKRLSLSGFGYPWEYMFIIGKLKNLEVLKLKHYAFQGPKLEMNHYGPFTKLKFLLVQDTDLVHWEFLMPVMPRLERLSLKHCYELEELPTSLPCPYVKEIEIEDCNPLTITWAEQMRLHRPVGVGFKVKSHLSWIVDIREE